MKEVRIAASRLFVLALCLSAVADAQSLSPATPTDPNQVAALSSQGGSSTEMALDWTERQDPGAALQAHDFSLLGDAIDLQSGRLSFETVDVSLPGNFALPVEIRRRMNPSVMQAGDFADWQLASIPSISTMILDDEWYANRRWGKTRCTTSNLVSAIPNASWPMHLQGGVLPPAMWNAGVILDVPGRTTGPILDKTVTAAWPTTAKKVTADGWYLECLSNIDGAGTEGFVAVAPNGDRYKFDVNLDGTVKKSEFDVWQVQNNGFPPAIYWQKIGVHYDTLAASEVRDVNGNTVTYEYGTTPGTLGKKLIGITASDGRHIDIARINAYISSVTVKDYDPVTHVQRSQRQWTYAYAGKSVTSYKPPDDANGVPGIRSETWSTLSTVTLPNGRQWLYDLANLQARPVPGVSYTASNNRGYLCVQLDQAVTVTHPDGVTGTFLLKEVPLYLGAGATYSSGAFCPNTNRGQSGSSQRIDVMAVTSKSLSGAGMPTSTWQYSYVSPGGSVDPIVTTVKQPDNSKRVSYFPTPFSFASPRIHARVSKEEVYATMTSPTPMETRTYTYKQEPDAGSHFLAGYTVQDTFRPVRVAETQITRDSDWYKTAYTYDTNRTSTTYSYGYPTHIEESSSLQVETRATDIAYSNNANYWVLGLTKSVQRNLKFFDSFEYDSLGRVYKHYRFGSAPASNDSVLWRIYGYNADGTIASVIDPVFRKTCFQQWYRGIPKEVDRTDPNQDCASGQKLFRTVDDYGWVRKIKNWNGYETTYEFDNAVGRLTNTTFPAPFNPIAFSYTYIGGKIVQTQTHGSEVTTTTYDAMLRPTQVKKHDNTGYASDIYIETTYDTSGRAVFGSLPATTAGSTIGIQTLFDPLDRKTQSAETATGGGTTRYEYLAGNKTRITDPLGYQTTHTSSGWGSPSDGNVVKIEKPEGVTVNFTYNIYGNQLSVAQTGADGSQLVGSFEYDSRLRLCRRKIPETGDTIYSYYDSNELGSYLEGQPGGSGCLGSGTDYVRLSYDLAGRILNTDYPGTTPDIARTYDPNGNLLTVNRGGVNWKYTYNSIDLIDTEKLSIDARSYFIDHDYGFNGEPTSLKYPSGQTAVLVNDGYGRPNDVYYGNALYLSATQYHPNGKIKTLNRGNGGTYQQKLNQRQLVSYIGGNWGTSLSFGDNYDAAGRLKAIDSPNNSYDRTFDYDGLGRLKASTGPWIAGSTTPYPGTYFYDTLGNLYQRSEGQTSAPRMVVTEYTPATNRIYRVRDTSAGNAWRYFNYDGRGNTTSNGIHNFTYDFANQPVTVTGPDVGSFVYDGNLKRVKQIVDGKTIYSIYDKAGSILVRDEVTDAKTTEFISLNGETFVRVTNGIPSYLLNDQLGTAYMVADQSGNITPSNTYNYMPYGESIGNDPGSQNRQGYTGHIEDETGLTYMKARYYDPIVGRFLSADPIGYADQLNLFAYVGNDPVNRTDPTGLIDCSKPNKPRTCMLSDTFIPSQSNHQTVLTTPELNAAAIANNSTLRVRRGSAEKLGFLVKDASGNIVLVTPSGVTTARTGNADTATARPPPNALAVDHAHIEQSSVGGQMPSDGLIDSGVGLGDSGPLKQGYTNFGGFQTRIKVHEINDGQLMIEMVSGAMTPHEWTELQEHLNNQQMQFMAPLDIQGVALPNFGE